ncbi:cytochrome c biogenesis CcdA family protein [Nocardioides jiangxiensis]|uniref:Cytochrome c biogenesis protein CcdA n=1 Tax=Nocardioides jiangxiensis TaxID=3064524 RepID=A0ABT9B164_9ACTN|nr:cytochrome c biogenesis protein CcdA [Nocardioides sp. WY-20]MDO7868596.1 cytochrome c biogenesis protein CcdA [Nocardioides sp. WY-20]
MTDFLRESVTSGSLVLALPVALLAGLISFFSPCCLPLLPGYLSYATGLSGAEIASGSRRRGRTFLGSLLFVLGFTAVFVPLGATVGALGDLGQQLNANRRLLVVVLGCVVILLGLFFAGLLRIPFLQRDVRVHRIPAVGLAAAPLIGVLFGLGWTPCVGPTLGAISALSFSEASATRGALLAGVFAFGLGLPFLLAGLAYERATHAFGWLRNHQTALMRLGGFMLVAVGVAMVSGWWDYAIQWLQIRLIEHFGSGA